MGGWKWEGILILVVLFLLLTGFFLTKLNVTNPLTGTQSVFDWFISGVADAVGNIFHGVFF